MSDWTPAVPPDRPFKERTEGALEFAYLWRLNLNRQGVVIYSKAQSGECSGLVRVDVEASTIPSAAPARQVVYLDGPIPVAEFEAMMTKLQTYGALTMPAQAQPKGRVVGRNYFDCLGVRFQTAEENWYTEVGDLHGDRHHEKILAAILRGSVGERFDRTTQD